MSLFSIYISIFSSLCLFFCFLVSLFSIYISIFSSLRLSLCFLVSLFSTYISIFSFLCLSFCFLVSLFSFYISLFSSLCPSTFISICARNAVSPSAYLSVLLPHPSLKSLPDTASVSPSLQILLGYAQSFTHEASINTPVQRRNEENTDSTIFFTTSCMN